MLAQINSPATRFRRKRLDLPFEAAAACNAWRLNFHKCIREEVCKYVFFTKIFTARCGAQSIEQFKALYLHGFREIA